MGKYKDIVYTLPEEKEIMKQLTDITDSLVESVRVTHPQKYSNFIVEIQKLKHINHFDDMLLKESQQYVPLHFSLQTTNKMSHDHFEIDFSKESFNEYDLNFITNDMYYHFSNMYQTEPHKYMELALSWLDKHEGKAKNYYERMYYSH